MTLPFQSLPPGLLPFAAMLLVFVALGITTVRWWSIYHGSESEPSADRSRKSHGYPLTLWRYIYDLDRSNTKRGITSVSEQTEALADADEKCRRR